MNKHTLKLILLIGLSSTNLNCQAATTASEADTEMQGPGRLSIVEPFERRQAENYARVCEFQTELSRVFTAIRQLPIPGEHRFTPDNKETLKKASENIIKLFCKNKEEGYVYPRGFGFSLTLSSIESTLNKFKSLHEYDYVDAAFMKKLLPYTGVFLHQVGAQIKDYDLPDDLSGRYFKLSYDLLNEVKQPTKLIAYHFSMLVLREGYCPKPTDEEKAKKLLEQVIRTKKLTAKKHKASPASVDLLSPVTPVLRLSPSDKDEAMEKFLSYALDGNEAEEELSRKRSAHDDSLGSNYKRQALKNVTYKDVARIYNLFLERKDSADSKSALIRDISKITDLTYTQVCKKINMYYKIADADYKVNTYDQKLIRNCAKANPAMTPKDIENMLGYPASQIHLVLDQQVIR